MPSGGAFAITARMSALVMSVAARGGIAGCDEVTACAARTNAASAAGTPFLMNAPCGRLLYAEACDDTRRLADDLQGAARRDRRREVGTRSLFLRRREDVR